LKEEPGDAKGLKPQEEVLHEQYEDSELRGPALKSAGPLRFSGFEAPGGG